MSFKLITKAQERIKHINDWVSEQNLSNTKRNSQPTKTAKVEASSIISRIGNSNPNKLKPLSKE